MTLSRNGGKEYDVHVSEVTAHDPALIATMLDIDLKTFSEPTWSRYTAGLMLRHGRTYLLFADEVPIGTCQCMRSWNSPWEVVLFSMAIRPGWRGQGLGTHFLEVVLDALKECGARSVVLEVDPKSTAAIRLYEQKFGFSVVAQCQDEYGPGHHRVHMRRLLTASPVAQVTEFPGLEELTEVTTLVTAQTIPGIGPEPSEDPQFPEASPVPAQAAEPDGTSA